MGLKIYSGRLLQRLRSLIRASVSTRLACAIWGAVAATALLGACGAGLVIKIYYLDPAKGLVRKQEGEVIPFSDAKGYRCVSSQDFDALLQSYASFKECCNSR